jgi:hypothetical protein
MPFLRLAATLSRIRSPITSRSNCANDSRMFKVSRPIDVVVLNDWVSTEEFDLSLSFDDLGNSGAVGSFEHFDQRRLLAGATLDHGRHRENVVTFGRRNFLGLAKRGISQRRCAKRDGARVFVVPPDGIGIVGRDLLDEAALQQALEHVANGAALDLAA